MIEVLASVTRFYNLILLLKLTCCFIIIIVRISKVMYFVPPSPIKSLIQGNGLSVLNIYPVFKLICFHQVPNGWTKQQTNTDYYFLTEIPSFNFPITYVITVICPK